jgi:hypothetical protein
MQQAAVIDPVLVYSITSEAVPIAYGIAVDAQGVVCVTGAATSTDFPIASAAQSVSNGGVTDAFSRWTRRVLSWSIPLH